LSRTHFISSPNKKGNSNKLSKKSIIEKNYLITLDYM
jgi:hypothetical protein